MTALFCFESTKREFENSLFASITNQLTSLLPLVRHKCTIIFKFLAKKNRLIVFLHITMGFQEGDGGLKHKEGIRKFPLCFNY